MRNRRHQHRNPHRPDEPCKDCKPDPRLKLLGLEEVMGLPLEDNAIFSLKVYVAAFALGMQEYTGSLNSIEASSLLEICRDEISRGHTIIVK